MLDLEYLKQHPESATPDQVLQLVRLAEFARNSLPDYAESAVQAKVEDGAIGDIKSAPR